MTRREELWLSILVVRLRQSTGTCARTPPLVQRSCLMTATEPAPNFNIGRDIPTGIVVDDRGNMFASGLFGGRVSEELLQVTFGHGEPNETILVSAGEAHIVGDL
jgi:hypothetical protein